MKSPVLLHHDNKSIFRAIFRKGLGRTMFLCILAIALIPLIIVGRISYENARTSLKNDAIESLSSAVKLKAAYIESYLSRSLDELRLQAHASGQIKFLEELKIAWLDSDSTLGEFIGSAPWKHIVEEFGDDLKYMHGIYRYNDVYLLDYEGNIIYSVRQGDDLGKNILQGESAASQFGQACLRARETGQPAWSDLQHYQPAANEPVSFLVQAITDGDGHRIGFLAFQLSIAWIDAIMQESTGLGGSGETYLVGRDLLMRSNSRLETAATVLRQRVDTVETRAWLLNLEPGRSQAEQRTPPDTPASIYPNYHGIEVLGVHRQLKLLDHMEVPWVVVGEISTLEAFRPAQNLHNFSLAILGSTALIVILLAILLTMHIVRPVRKMSEWVGRVAAGDLAYEEIKERKDEIGEMGVSFTRLVDSFREVARICEAIAIGDLQQSVQVRGTNDRLARSVNQMAENLRQVVRQAERIGSGNYAVEVTPHSDKDELGVALAHMTAVLRQVSGENQEALEQAKQLLDNLDNLPTPVFTIDTDFNVTYINPAGASVAGLSAADCIGARCQGLFMTTLCHTRDCPANKAIEIGKTTQGESCIDPGGLNMPVEFSTAPIRDNKGHIVGVLEYFVDISKRMAVMDKIRRQEWLREGQVRLNQSMRGEQEIEELSRNIVTFLVSYLQAQIGALYVVYERNLKLTGFYGGNPEDFGPEFKLGEGLVGEAALGKKIIQLTELPPDYPKIRSGLGETAVRHLMMIPFLYYGTLKGVIEVGSLHEFSQQEQEFLAQVVESIGIAIASAESRDKLAGLLTETQRQARELQVQQEELRQANEELEEQTIALKASEEELQAQQEELRATNEELEERTMALEKQQEAIRRSNVELEKARNTLEEKTRDLELAGKYKSEFLANMSHELRTPLNSMLILSKLMTDNKEKNLTPRQVEFAATIHAAGNDLLKLINEILDLSKVEAGKMAINLEPVQLSDLAESMNQQFRALADDKGLDFVIELDESLPVFIRTDRQRVEQILKNFLSNAFKFTNQGQVKLKIGPGAAHIDAKRSGLADSEVISLIVSDTGLGIPQSEQERIFEAFQQVDGTTSRKHGGTGLGLTISRKFADLLGGSIWVKSKEGEGSEFILILPAIATGQETAGARQPQQVETLPAPGNAGQQARPGENERVVDDRRAAKPGDKTLLVVEDDPKFAQILKTLAQEKGFKCLIAESGESGLHFADFYQPQGIILDIGLPGMDGLTVMQRLKSNPKTRHIPIHVVSGSEKKLDAMRLGAVGFLSKPATLKELSTAFSRIDMVLEKIKKVLVAWGDRTTAEDIISLVSGHDVEVTAVFSGDEVVSHLQSGVFDCMIMDFDIDQGNGMKLLSKIATVESVKRIPIIIYANEHLSEDEEAGLQVYADSIVLKEVRSPEKLLDEATLFLHRVEKDLPEDKKQALRTFRERDVVFKDRKILIADDDMRNVFALTSILEEKGMQVVVGRNGHECLTRLQEAPDVDLVIMDIMMPEMDGYDAMREIRKLEQFKKLPIIALTAKAMKGDKKKCIEAGASDYMAKPVQTDKLLSLLRVWLYR